MTAPIPRNRISNPNSLMLDRMVNPSACRPVECRASLKILIILNVLTIRSSLKNCAILRTSFAFSVLFCSESGSSKPAEYRITVTKYGIIAKRSIQFITLEKNVTLFGHDNNLLQNKSVQIIIGSRIYLTKNSIVNHDIYTISMIANIQ